MQTPIALALVLATFAPALAAPTVGTAVGDTIPQFTAQTVDLSGNTPETKSFDSHATKHVTAYLFVGTTCPATQAYVDRIRELQRTYGAKNVDFVFDYPNKTDSSDAKRAFHKEKFAGPMIDDEGGKIAKLLGAQKTSEVVIADKDGVILYRGAIDDSPHEPAKVGTRYVATALDEHLGGKKVAVASTPVFA